MKTAIRILGYILLFGGFLAVHPIERLNATEARRVVVVQHGKTYPKESFTRDEVRAQMEDLRQAIEDSRISTFWCAFAMLGGALMIVCFPSKPANS